MFVQLNLTSHHSSECCIQPIDLPGPSRWHWTTWYRWRPAPPWRSGQMVWPDEEEPGSQLPFGSAQSGCHWSSEVACRTKISCSPNTERPKNYAHGLNMMTSSKANIFCITGLLWGESTAHLWIPFIKVSDAVLCFLWSVHEQMVEQTIETPVIWDAIVLIITSL